MTDTKRGKEWKKLGKGKGIRGNRIIKEFSGLGI